MNTKNILMTNNVTYANNKKIIVYNGHVLISNQISGYSQSAAR